MSAGFDNTKIRRFVPGFLPRIRFADGIRRTIAWFEADTTRQKMDPVTDQLLDKVISSYERGLAEALKSFAP